MKPLFALTLGVALMGALTLSADEVKPPAKPAAPAVPPTPPAPPVPNRSSASAFNARFMEKYDANKDGKLDETERAAIRQDKENEAKERLKKYDKNGDGKLDAQEKIALREDLQKQRPIPAEPPPAPKLVEEPKAPEQK